MANTMARVLRSISLSKSPDRYKVFGFLVIKPILIAEVI
jgi:hypothetical protein